MFDPNDPTPYVERPSRSEKKRGQVALREFIEMLVELTPGAFAKLELSDELKKALVDARRLPAHNARRRQILFATGLLDEEDAANIKAKLQATGQSR